MSILVGTVPRKNIQFIENCVGEIDIEDLHSIEDVIKDLDLKCLPFIDPYDNTIFNHKQCLQLKREIEYLHDHPISKDLLHVLSVGIREALKSKDLYLKIEGE